MSLLKKFNKLQIVQIIYWLFLTYMVAAFIWWYVALVQQNKLLTATKIEALSVNTVSYDKKVQEISAFEKRKTLQYIGEGVTFLFLFLIGAIYVYRSLLKQLRYSNQQQNFMMAVTHELKTPIAVTQLNLETIIKRDLAPEQKEMLIANSLKETKRLDVLCNNILLASQLDMGQYDTEKQLVDLSQICNQCVKSFQERFPNRLSGINLQEGIHIQGESLLLQLLVNNLLDNANKYTLENTPIDIELMQQAGSIYLKVKDQGLGIPANERNKVFEKFYRVGSENTRATKGTGLGLFLCKKITQFHGASIAVTDNQPNGSIFTVQFNL